MNLQTYFRIVGYLAATACIPVLFSGDAHVRAQAPPSSTDSRPSSARISHQMNQPLPAPSSRRKLSQERIDEIRKLYEAALKEADRRSDATTTKK